eukprot:TRINITY_DN5394_c0_g1_i1.p1 TRINITY_DN5394_c0_g1~~TRINITY_DN5394_c0_g1_i1.p1  ORF type:complete len:205 (+),score=7.47 TRINITY_DN5394_c0_g1_i1:797-1411(+)
MASTRRGGSFVSAANPAASQTTAPSSSRRASPAKGLRDDEDDPKTRATAAAAAVNDNAVEDDGDDDDELADAFIRAAVAGQAPVASVVNATVGSPRVAASMSTKEQADGRAALTNKETTSIADLGTATRQAFSTVAPTVGGQKKGVLEAASSRRDGGRRTSSGVGFGLLNGYSKATLVPTFDQGPRITRAGRWLLEILDLEAGS